MKKRLSKILWYGEELPNPATSSDDLEGLHEGELFLHLKDDGVTLWSLSADGRVVEISGGGGGDLSQYLLKSIWDRVWEIKTDSQGNEYIFGKLPVVTQYGITMYADGGELNLPSIYAGIPFDNKTIWLNPETKKVEVIGGTGGGVADSVHWNNIEGKPSFSAVATSGKYADLSGLPDLNVYATTEYLTAELKKYVTLNTEQTIGAHKDFLNGLSIGGLPITKSQDDVIYLDANLVVRGGITMFGTNSVDVPTIMDAIATDNVNLKVVDGVLTFVGSSGGGLTEVYWDDVIGKPTLLSSFIDDVGYLQKSGGQMTGNIGYTLERDTTYSVGLPVSGSASFTDFYSFMQSSKTFIGSILNSSSGVWFDLISLRHTNGHGSDGVKYGMYIITKLSENDNLSWNKQINGTWQGERVILDSRNWSQYVTAADGGSYLPLSGGTLNGALYVKSSNAGVLSLYRTVVGGGAWIDYYPSNQSSMMWRVGAQTHDKFVFASYAGDESFRFSYNSANGRKFEVGQDCSTIGAITDDRRAVISVISTSNVPSDIIMGANYYDWSMTARDSSENYQLAFYSARNGLYAMTIQHNGNVLAHGGITMYSDIRKKTKLQDVELSLKQIADAPLIEHYYNSDAMRTTHVGSIAQYWADMNDWFCKLDGEGFYTMEIQNAALASAISIARELVKYESKTDKEIRLLKDEVKRLKKEIKILKSV